MSDFKIHTIHVTVRLEMEGDAFMEETGSCFDEDWFRDSDTFERAVIVALHNALSKLGKKVGDMICSTQMTSSKSSSPSSRSGLNAENVSTETSRSEPAPPQP